MNKKEIHASFVDAPQIDKVMATVSDNCLIKVEMDLNLLQVQPTPQGSLDHNPPSRFALSLSLKVKVLLFLYSCFYIKRLFINKVKG